MSEVVLMECPHCGQVFERKSKTQKYCSPHCREADECRRYMDAHFDKGAARVRAMAERAAKRRRRQLFAKLDREYAAVGVRETVRVSDGVRVVSRGTVGGGCCVGSTTGFNPRPFDLRLFKP